MEARIDFTKADPGAARAMFGLEAYVRNSGLEPSLIYLIKVRASQLNGCAYCIDMHTKDARAGGESEQRLYLLDAWREAPFYTARERAALEWTEAVTLIAKDRVPDEVYARVRQQFSEAELVNLTMAVQRLEPAGHQFSRGSRQLPGCASMRRALCQTQSCHNLIS